jgi:hypothetical protein
MGLLARLRHVNEAQQVLFALSLLFGWFNSRLHELVVVATLAEMTQWLGHMWLPPPTRRMPFFCPVQVVTPVHWALSLSAIFCLVARLFVASRVLLGLGTLLLLAACLLDLWRLLYLHYWLLMLLSLVVEPDTALQSLTLLLGSLYMWAGFFKLTSRPFYRYTAPSVFELPFRFVPTSLHTAVAAVGVGGEMLIGAYLLVGRHVFPGLASLVICSVIAMHAYICLAIGVASGVRTFISWNCFCAVSVAVILNSPQCHTSLTVWHGFLLVVMHAFPLLQLLGLNEWPTLSHSYFVPLACGGSCYWVCDASERGKIPASDNGRAVAVYREGTRPHQRIAEMFGKQIQLTSFVVLSGGWVDDVYSYTELEHDPYNECFGAGPPVFFRWVQRGLNIRGPTYFVQFDCNALLRPQLPRRRLVTL